MSRDRSWAFALSARGVAAALSLCLVAAAPLQKKGAAESAAESKLQQQLASQKNQLADEDRRKVESAIPAKAQVKPKRPRKLLVVTLNMRDGVERRGHSSIPAGNYAIQMMGQRTGAYEAVFNNDPSVFRPEDLKQYDAICFNNTVGVLTNDPGLRESLLAFVRAGKGFVGFHAAAATFVQYPKYDQFPPFGEMLGGYENGGHPWGPKDEISIKVEDPKHPVNAAFRGQDFDISDEVFQFGEPYRRDRVRVLLSIDTSKTDMDPRRRFLSDRAKDRDFPMSWVRNHGKGRVFYSSFGHNPEIFWNAAMLRHFLAGIQFALGDLKADARPSPR